MRILSSEELPAILARLETGIPRSLPVYHTVRNAIRDKFPWPGIEFVLDKFPDFSVCIIRPKSGAKDFVPIMNGYQIYIYSKDDDILRTMLFEERVIDWSQQNILFAHTTEPENQLLLNEGPKMTGGCFEGFDDVEGYPSGDHCFFFDLPTLEINYTVPKGFREGPLLPEHAERISIERSYGVPSKNAEFFRYLFMQDFPTFALFPEQSNTPVAYVMYKCQGTVGSAFVHPDYRSRGLYKVVLQGILRKLRDLGEVHVWAEVHTSNTISQKGMRAVGGKELSENYRTHWINAWPQGKSSKISLLDV